MMHLDAIIKRNRRPASQPTREQSIYFDQARRNARYDHRPVGPMDHDVFTRDGVLFASSPAPGAL